MKKIRKFLCATVLSSAMMFSMCACGSDSGSTTAASGGGDNTEAATSAATEAKPSGGGTIKALRTWRRFSPQRTAMN